MSMYVADFETSKENDKTWVWSWGFCEIGNIDNFHYGSHMDEFMSWCQKGKVNKTVFFHNLRFDGEFIFHWLLENGFTFDAGKKREKTFSCLISGQGAFYSIEVIFKKLNKRVNKVTFLDSAKKFPGMSVARVAKGFGLPMSKGDIDHDVVRYPGHVMNDEELDYLKRDVQIIAMALGIQFEQDLDRMTVGGDAMKDFKAGLAGGDMKKGRKLFERYFPTLPLPIDTMIRGAYRGGFTYVNPIYAGVDIDKGVVFDINSMYPWAMRYKDLPYSMPLPFKGKYEKDRQYPLYIQRIRCGFKLKPNHLPTIQIKNNLRYKATEYLTTHVTRLGNAWNDEPVELTLTNIDLELFFEHYDVDDVEYLDGFMFKSCNGMFNRYIDYWMGVKVQAEIDGNESQRTLAKLMLNNLYGKFGSNPDVTGRHPYLQEDGSIGFEDNDEEFTDPVYTAMAAFITSYCRDNIIRSGQSVYDRFIYADTDSLHLIGDEMPQLAIHKTRLGAWKHENTFERARFLRAKAYIEEIDGQLHVKCAGMPDNLKKHVTWHNFHFYNEDMYLPARDGHWFGKLTPRHVSGGQILEPTSYKLTEKAML